VPGGAPSYRRTLMFPNVFPMGMKTAPGDISGSRFDW